MIKLIASDIDGTLVPDGSDKINPEIFPVILQLKKQGIYFVAASGRQWKSIERLFEPIKDEIFYIAENGAYVGARGRELFTVPMAPDVVKEIIKDARKIPECDLMLSGPCTPSYAKHQNNWVYKGSNVKGNCVYNGLNK